MSCADPSGFLTTGNSSHDQDPCRRGRSLARPRRIRRRAGTPPRPAAPMASHATIIIITIIITITITTTCTMAARAGSRAMKLRLQATQFVSSTATQLSARLSFGNLLLSGRRPVWKAFLLQALDPGSRSRSFSAAPACASGPRPAAPRPGEPPPPTMCARPAASAPCDGRCCAGFAASRASWSPAGKSRSRQACPRDSRRRRAASRAAPAATGGAGSVGGGGASPCAALNHS